MMALFRKLRQEDQEFEGSLGYVMSFWMSNRFKDSLNYMARIFHYRKAISIAQ